MLLDDFNALFAASAVALLVCAAIGVGLALLHAICAAVALGRSPAPARLFWFLLLVLPWLAFAVMSGRNGAELLIGIHMVLVAALLVAWRFVIYEHRTFGLQAIFSAIFFSACLVAALTQTIPASSPIWRQIAVLVVGSAIFAIDLVIARWTSIDIFHRWLTLSLVGILQAAGWVALTWYVLARPAVHQGILGGNLTLAVAILAAHEWTLILIFRTILRSRLVGSAQGSAGGDRPVDDERRSDALP